MINFVKPPKNAVVFDAPGSKNATCMQTILEGKGYTVHYYDKMENIKKLAQSQNVFGEHNELIICAPSNDQFAIDGNNVEALIHYCTDGKSVRKLPIFLYPCDDQQAQGINTELLENYPNVKMVHKLDEESVTKALLGIKNMLASNRPSLTRQ